MQMKLTPFYLFLIVLIVLVISMLFGNWFINDRGYNIIEESFVDFQNDKNTTGGVATYIPQYSGSNKNKTVTSLYDNLYFDIQNGNLIEVQSTDSSSNDTSGNSIQKLFVTPRTGSNTDIYPINNGTFNTSNMTNIANESLTSTVASSYSQFFYNTLSSSGNKYNVLYSNWDTNTFLTIFDSMMNIISISLFNGSNLLSLVPKNNLSTVQTNQIGNQSTFSPSQTQNVYQISQNVSYNISSGNIVIGNSTYNRTNGSITNSNSFTHSSSLNSWTASDPSGGLVLVISYKNQTIVTILSKNNGSISIVTCVRFNQNGLVTNKSTDVGTDINQIISANTGANGISTVGNNIGTSFPGSHPPPVSKVCGDDLSCKWYWYFHTLVDNSYNITTNDYFMKSEVVPPVCPTCPACPSSGTCVNCGGNGGSGTIKNDSSGNVSNNGSASGTGAARKNITRVNADGSFISDMDPDTIGGGLALSSLSLDQLGTATVNATGNAFNNTVNTVGNTVNKGLDNVSGLIGGAGIAATGLVAGAGSAAYNLANNAGTGAYNLVNNAGSGASNLLRDTGSGIVNLGNKSNRGSNGYSNGYSNGSPNGSYNGSMNRGTGAYYRNQGLNGISDKNQGYMGTNTPIDNYSYYGAIESKGGNYMPVTADFSAFRK